MLIFERSRPGRRATAQSPADAASVDDLPAAALRSDVPAFDIFSKLITHVVRDVNDKNKAASSGRAGKLRTQTRRKFFH